MVGMWLVLRFLFVMFMVCVICLFFVVQFKVGVFVLCCGVAGVSVSLIVVCLCVLVYGMCVVFRSMCVSCCLCVFSDGYSWS